jgi:hypothetical protein
VLKAEISPGTSGQCISLQAIAHFAKNINPLLVLTLTDLKRQLLAAAVFVFVIDVRT